MDYSRDRHRTGRRRLRARDRHHSGLRRHTEEHPAHHVVERPMVGHDDRRAAAAGQQWSEHGVVVDDVAIGKRVICSQHVSRFQRTGPDRRCWLREQRAPRDRSGRSTDGKQTNVVTDIAQPSREVVDDRLGASIGRWGHRDPWGRNETDPHRVAGSVARFESRARSRCAVKLPQLTEPQQPLRATARALQDRHRVRRKQGQPAHVACRAPVYGGEHRLEVKAYRVSLASRLVDHCCASSGSCAPYQRPSRVHGAPLAPPRHVDHAAAGRWAPTLSGCLAVPRAGCGRPAPGRRAHCRPDA